MTTSLHRKGTAVVAAILLASALSILSVSTVRADPLSRSTAATAVTSGSVTPPAGTAGRGGVALLPAVALAGTAGRGGVTLAPLAAAGTSAAAAAAVATGGSGGVSTLAAGRVPAPLPSAPADAGWIAFGITAAALIGGAAIWWALARRDRASAQPASVSSINPVVESSDAVSQEWERKAA